MQSNRSSMLEVASLVDTMSRRSMIVSSRPRYYEQRPFVVPVFDPQHTNEDPPRQNQYQPSLAGSQPSYPHPGEDNFTLKEQAHFEWYGGQGGSHDSCTLSLVDDRRSTVSKSTGSSLAIQDTVAKPPRLQVKRLSGGCAEYMAGPPDGGQVAWLHVLVGFFVVLNAQGLNMSYGIFQAYYEKILLAGTSSAKIAWIGSVQIFFLFFMSLVVAKALERGLFRLCFHGGSVLLFISILLTSFCSKWWQLFLVQGVVSGIGMGSIFSSGLMILLAYFSNHLATATGIAAAGAPVGGVLFPLIARTAIEHVGFGWTVRVFALVNLVTMAVANAVIRPRPQLPSQMSSTKQNTGPRERLSAKLAFILMTAGMFFTFWGFYIAFYYMVLYGQDALKMSETSSVNLLIAMSAANLAGRFVPSFISDACIGPLNTITPWTFVTAMLAFSWIAATNSTGLFLISCFYGFTSAAVQSLYTSAIVAFSGRGTEAAARKMGVVLSVIAVAVLTGSPIGGALIARGNGSYLQTQIFAGVTLTIGGAFFLAARIVRSGWRPDRI